MKMDKQTKIAYLGPKGTFTEYAAMTLFPSYELIPFPSIPDCMDGVSKGDVDYTVVPIENTIEGSVNVTLDYLVHKNRLSIVGEIIVPIKQHLLIHPLHLQDWSKVKKVYSHPHAIAQCHEFLRSKLPNAKAEYMNSTSAAAEFVARNGHECIAAIGNHLAAKEYNLVITHKNIHDYENNHTKFIILNNNEQEETLNSELYVGDKTTLVVTLPADYPGALHHALSAFAWRKLNLSKIESRPSKTGLGNYFFIIDVDMKLDDILIPGVMAELQALNCQVELLGSYPCYSLSEKVNV
ncbi:MAG: prephenate dehydratase [Bacillaceae bacterium]|nr:prephenate dehydratase [Bacillaceae bacterium]